MQYIRDNTEVDQWHYVQTKSNPADLASRGASPEELIKSNWFKGPKFLEEEKLPIEDSTSELILGDPEVKTQCLKSENSTIRYNIIERLNNFSTWKGMLTALSVLKRKLKGKRSKVAEQEDARNTILKCLQDSQFAEEMKYLTQKGYVSNSSKLSNLDAKVDKNGLIRVGGRMNSTQALTDEENHPVILPSKAHITRVIIEDVHSKVNHGGRSLTLNGLRSQGYHVLRGSKTVAQIIRNCVTCRKLRRKTETQKMAELPPQRTEQCPVFTNSGMDVINGPYVVKRARTEIKRYGLLFTCLYSRAIHIELLDDLTTDCFINALRCFISLRGVVKMIFCDNATNFIGANNEMKQALKQMEPEKIENFLASKQVEFKFNTPHASHQGGVYERQIRTVRDVLRSVIDLANLRLDDSSLRTLLYEASYIVNSRPLSVTSLNDPLSDPPITPNALIHGKIEGVLPPPGKFVPQDIYARKRWRRVQYMAEQFWSKWKAEYLTSLQIRQKWQQEKRNVKVGDIVLMVEENEPRCHWPLGIVTKAEKDKDGLVRKVQLKVSNIKSVNKTKQTSELERPIQKIVVLIEV